MIAKRAATAFQLTFVLCLAEVLGMTGFATFPALLPTFFADWGLSNTDAGWINGIYFAGYMIAVPVLTSLTDHVPPRRVYVGSMVLCAVASLGFAFAAEGFWTALLFRALAGAGLAGTYMPGLKLLSDHLEGHHRASRGVAFYTASFGIGSSLSLLLAGWVEPAYGWAMAFLLAGLGPLVAVVLLVGWFPLEDPRPHARPDTHLLDFRPVLKTRNAMGFVLAYAAHNFELFAVRSWSVAFLVFAAAASGAETLIAATVIAALLNLFGVPSSIIGNEWAQRFGRRRVITIVMLLSALMAAGIGFLAAMPFWGLVAVFAVYSLFVTGDSAALTAGAVIAAPRGYRGATMAVHASIGFLGAALGPLLFGVTLDIAGGGQQTVFAWGVAFLMTGMVVALGPAAVRALVERDR